jgi:hypothetical protein
MFTGSHKENCVPGGSLSGVELAAFSAFNLTQLQSLGFVFDYQSSYNSSVNGMPCSLITGNLFQVAANGTDTSSGNYEMCISDTYYVPVMLAFTLSGGSGSFYAALNATDVGPTAQQGDFASLP